MAVHIPTLKKKIKQACEMKAAWQLKSYAKLFLSDGCSN